ncbi:hypothetical protein CNMCM6936_005530 [Aspergillus lentulus]|uniref:Myb-like domain-containing protein n=1 Tax=Aspergillus lentulus TaxID=293939 RepID=A0AAN5YN75_ASPLE|nr:hypothetical protein CNMCM6069_008399 [Aspergillus lentulus]KAF4167280.1 hypothetical protein CNMCM6936_005530 [Aspergillus lentulus]KAF4173483.1 hypothetical protein CNMCM8060_000061 [Aspergillus lentulus]KAF4193419.1 hypothetical protein CNMCM8694_008947 [Aspergillus lentulus]KAF4204693.1 hypothetical protein CNMCM8927_007200 [Aspergillus lentulus]
MPASRIRWDDWKDKVMLMAVFEQMNMTSPDFKRLSKVMCGDYSADALKNRFRALNKEAAAILRDRQRHAESREMTDETLPMMSGAVNGPDENDVAVIREVALRSELTPPPSEPSPSMQSRRCPPQTQRAMPEVVTQNSQLSSVDHHTQSSGVQYQQQSSLNYEPNVHPARRPQCSHEATSPARPYKHPRSSSQIASGGQQERGWDQTLRAKNTGGRPFKPRNKNNRQRNIPQMTRVEINHGPVHSKF